MTTYLQPQYSTQKSFNNKATVTAEGGKVTLHSYNTLVATIENGEAKVYNTQSQTTVKHVKEFLLQNGFTADSKKQIEKDYMN